MWLLWSRLHSSCYWFQFSLNFRAILAEYSGAVLGVLSALLYGWKGHIWKKVVLLYMVNHKSVQFYELLDYWKQNMFISIPRSIEHFVLNVSAISEHWSPDSSHSSELAVSFSTWSFWLQDIVLTRDLTWVLTLLMWSNWKAVDIFFFPLICWVSADF